MIKQGDLLVSEVRVTVLVDSLTRFEGPILAENGLSLLVEIPELDLKILFDVGITGHALINNSKVLGMDLSEVDFIVLSHNHYDHTGGLLKTPISGKIVVAHPEIFLPKYSLVPSLGMKTLTYTGPPFRKEDLEKSGANLILSKNPVKLAPGVLTTGEIPRRNDMERVEGFYVNRNDEFVEDQLPDDQALLIEMDDGLIVLTGCCHSGLINTLEWATELTGREIKALIGGFHLIDADEKRINETIKRISNFNMKIVAPLHCTGLKATLMFYRTMESSFREIWAGKSLEIS